MNRFLMLVALVVAVLVGVLIAKRLWPQRPPIVRTVFVGITGDSVPFSIIPDPATAYVDDTLAWIHPTADTIEVDFSADTAGVRLFGRRPLVAARGDTARTAVGQVSQETRIKYSVIVTIGARRDTIDPVIVVKPKW